MIQHIYNRIRNLPYRRILFQIRIKRLKNNIYWLLIIFNDNDGIFITDIGYQQPWRAIADSHFEVAVDIRNSTVFRIYLHYRYARDNALIRQLHMSGHLVYLSMRNNADRQDQNEYDDRLLHCLIRDFKQTAF